MRTVYDKLIQKYLAGKTSRDEEKYLLDLTLKDINTLLCKFQEVKKRFEK